MSLAQRTVLSAVVALLGSAAASDGQFFPTSTPIVASTTTTGDQRRIRISISTNGNVAVVWEASEFLTPPPVEGAFYRLYDSDGTPLTGETMLEANGERPDVVMLDTGESVVAWFAAGELHAQRFDSAGNPAGGIVTMQVGGFQVALTAGDSGEFIAAYGLAGSGEDIVVRGFDATISPVWPAFQANTTTLDDQRVASLDCEAGSCTVAWIDESTFPTRTRYRHFTTAGAPVGGEFEGPVYQPTEVDTGSSDPGVAQSLGGATAIASRVFANIFNSETYTSAQLYVGGVPNGPEIRLNDLGSAPDMAALGVDDNNNFYAATNHLVSNATRVVVQQFDAFGDRSDPFVASVPKVVTVSDVDISVAANGRFVVAWTDRAPNDGSGEGVYFRLFDVPSLSALCNPAPTVGCRTGAGSLSFKNSGTSGKDRLKFKWKGEETTFPELADPTTTDDYALCVYLNGTLAHGFAIPAGTSWKQIGPPSTPKGFKYKFKPGVPNGVTTTVLKAGADNKARIKVIGKGGNLQMAPGPLGAPIVAQVVRESSSVCWEASFSGAEISQNDSEGLKAKN